MRSPRQQPAPRGDHAEKQGAESAFHHARLEDQQLTRTQRRGGNCGRAMVRVGAPVDLAPPHCLAREIRHPPGDRHDRGFARAKRQHERGHQHDGGTEADDGAERAGGETQREDRNPGHATSPRRHCIGRPCRSASREAASRTQPATEWQRLPASAQIKTADACASAVASGGSAKAICRGSPRQRAPRPAPSCR